MAAPPPSGPPPSLARAALSPIPLAFLAAGGVAGAAVAWPFAAAGALCYAVGVAIASGGGGADGARGAGGPLRPPFPGACAVKHTEVMALVVRIRNGHKAMHRALIDAPPPVRATFTSTYGKMDDLVAGAVRLAEKADRMRAHLDRGSACGCSGGAVHDKLREEYGEARKRLEDLGGTIERWNDTIVALDADHQDAARAGSEAMADELERMDHLVRALDEAARS